MFNEYVFCDDESLMGNYSSHAPGRQLLGPTKLDLIENESLQNFQTGCTSDLNEQRYITGARVESQVIGNRSKRVKLRYSESFCNFEKRCALERHLGGIIVAPARLQEAHSARTFFRFSHNSNLKPAAK